jgi:hypothetical protein
MVCEQADTKILSLGITETNTSYKWCILAPGQYPGNFRVFVEGDKVTVTNENVRWDEAIPGNDYSTYPFSQSFRTMDEIDHEQIRAVYMDDMIELTLGKKQTHPETKTKSKSNIHLHNPHV